MQHSYFLTPYAISKLREHKNWSLEKFGRAQTRRYFQDMDKGFQFIADNYGHFPSRAGLTGNSGLSIYPVCEHYVVFVALKDGVHIVDILGKAQDIPNILEEFAETFQEELAMLFSASTKQTRRKRR